MIKMLFKGALVTVFTLSIHTCLNKQCRPRSDMAECGVCSESTLFATHPAVSDTTDTKIDLWTLSDEYDKEMKRSVT